MIISVGYVYEAPWQVHVTPYRAGRTGQTYPCATMRELADWFSGFARACREARQ